MSFGFVSAQNLKSSVRGGEFTVATSSYTGAVRPDGTSISITTEGVIGASISTQTTYGIVKPDNTSISITANGILKLNPNLTTSLAVTGNLSIVGNETLTGNLTLTGATNLRGTVTVTGNTTVSGTLSVIGATGQLFTIIDTSTGTLFGVNDGSGIPSLEVVDDGTVRVAQYGGNVGVGTGAPAYKLDVVGTVKTTSGLVFGDSTQQTTKAVNGRLVTVLTSGTGATWNRNSNTIIAEVWCTGAGGGGGGADGDGASGSAGGGGGGGGTAYKLFTAAELGASALYTIGGGGGGGNTVGTNGTGGGASTFDPAGTGLTMQGNGGNGGNGTGNAFTLANAVFSGGGGGGGSGYDTFIVGNAGHTGIGFTGVYCAGGNGGASYWGGAGLGAAQTALANGGAGQWYGSGGGGAVSGGSTTGASGGAGYGGVIVIVEYLGS